MFDTLFDALAPVLAEEFAATLVATVFGILTGLSGLALDQLRRWLGEKRVSEAAARLTPAIDRAIAAAEAAGVTPDRIAAEAQAYIERTMRDTLRRLRPGPGDLRSRIEAQIAERTNFGRLMEIVP